MPNADHNPSASDQVTASWIELAIRLGVLGFLLYLSLFLIYPFLTIAVWSVVIAVALYPLYERIVDLVGGRRRLAAVLLTLLSLTVVIGPATWLALSLIDSVRTLAERLDLSALALPPPSQSVKSWPLIGDSIYKFWELASNNLQATIVQIAPSLKPIGSSLLHIAADAGTGIIQFLLAIVIAGFLYSPAPALVDTIRRLSRRLASARGEEFVRLAVSTIRAVSRGVIGISALQALLAAVGLVAAGIPAASLITSAVLILGIIQIGPSIVLIPLIIWSWTAMDTTKALLFTAYMIPVNLVDNALRPLVLGRGLDTPILVILIGVIGGTISYGITGLFLGPIILAVIWELLMAWIRESEDIPVDCGPK
jgi:predicted PurR-regulated permease PerM